MDEATHSHWAVSSGRWTATRYYSFPLGGRDGVVERHGGQKHNVFDDNAQQLYLLHTYTSCTAAESRTPRAAARFGAFRGARARRTRFPRSDSRERGPFLLGNVQAVSFRAI